MRNAILALGLLLLVACQTGQRQHRFTANDWKHQVDSLLMPFWMMNAALGQPTGNFPNYRKTDGSNVAYETFDFGSVPPEFSFLTTQTDSLRRDFLRMKSRQTFAYGVAFHLTGNEEYLKLAQLGVRFLLQHGDYESGFPVTYWMNGQAHPKPSQRTTQDLAYALAGLTFYYYLTRDPSLLDPMMKVQSTIHRRYFDASDISAETKLMKWVLEDYESDRASSRFLVSHLDQINAYQLLLTGIAPEHLRPQLTVRLKLNAHAIRKNFYDQDLNMFWGDLDDRSFGQDYTDFGHSIKSFWMLYLTGLEVGDDELTDFARTNALRLLAEAYVSDSQAWGHGYADRSLAMDSTKIWWIFAELDQMAGTLSLQQPSLYSQYLVNSYRYWNDHLIDKEHGETWIGLAPDGSVLGRELPKAFHWKNGYHTLEHALVGYISTANFWGDDITLFYAFDKNATPDSSRIKPYYFRGDIRTISSSGFSTPALNGYQKTEVVFRRVY